MIPVQYICYYISFPHYSKFQRTVLLIFDAITRYPSLLLHVGTTVSLDPIATPLQRLDQSVPREFS